MGYIETPHNYRVYFLDNRLTFMRRDIKFNEEKAMKLSLEREIHLHAEEDATSTEVVDATVYR